jgi:6-phosphogluconolactonase
MKLGRNTGFFHDFLMRLLLITAISVTLAVHCALAVAKETGRDEPKKAWLYIGTYTGRGSKGIYRCELDLGNGRLSVPVMAAEATNPAFLAIHPNRRFLYAVGEVGEFAGQKSGGVSSFGIDPQTGNLTLLNQQPSGGAGPCHLVVDGQGKNVLVANYGGGSVCVLPILPDGKLKEKASLVQHEGKSVNAQRQESPHAHSINLDATNRRAFAADLGVDKILIYRFDATAGTLTPNDPPHLSLAPGAGPRHFAFHPDGRHAYVINELHSTVSALAYEPDKGELKILQTISTLPMDFRGVNHTAEVQVHPSGKFLYGSNRGHDSVAVFAIDSNTGTLTARGHVAEGIKTPRNFGIDPTGRYVVVANQGADNVIVFRVDADTGALQPTGHRIEVPQPVCVKMMAPP